MQDAQRQTRSHLMELLQKRGVHPRSDLGQNFLIDLNIIEFVVRNGELTQRDLVLEVGSGTGGMTSFLAEQAGHVVSVEYDRKMYQLAGEATAGFENVTLLNVDALRNKNNFSTQVIEAVDKQLALDPARRLKLIANLPYNIATPVVSNLVASDWPWVRMVLTIQFELGLRMRAEPRSSHYGSLSVWLQSQCYVKMIKKLGPSVFWPRPKVDSAIMRISPNHQARQKIADRAFFHDYVRRVFNQRRKFLRSVLAGMYRKDLPKTAVDEILQSMQLAQTTRAEELPVETHVALANRAYSAVQGARA